MTDEFYVYGYFDAQDGTPFYIGKGKGSRLYHHLKEAVNPNTKDKNKHKIRKIKKHISYGTNPVIEIIDGGLSESVAFELEEFLIKTIGRADLGNGPLTNMSDGGEGLVGLIRDMGGVKNPNYGKRGEESIWWGKSHTEETKEKMRLSQVGKIFSEDHKLAMRKPKSDAGREAIALARRTSSYRPSDETKKKISEALSGRLSPNKGKTVSAETKAKHSLARKGAPKAKTACMHCGLMCAPHVLHRWHMDNCKERQHAA